MATDASESDHIFASSMPIGLHAVMVTTALFVAPVLLLSMVGPFGVRLRAEGFGRVLLVASDGDPGIERQPPDSRSRDGGWRKP
jgi:hypothetical protein